MRSLCSRYLKLSGPAKLSTPEKIEKIYLNKDAEKNQCKSLGVIIFILLGISYFRHHCDTNTHHLFAFLMDPSDDLNTLLKSIYFLLKNFSLKKLLNLAIICPL